jgi:hypothetical protein
MKIPIPKAPNPGTHASRNLIPTVHVVGKVDPAAVGLEPDRVPCKPCTDLRKKTVPTAARAKPLLGETERTGHPGELL